MKNTLVFMYALVALFWGCGDPENKAGNEMEPAGQPQATLKDLEPPVFDLEVYFFDVGKVTSLEPTYTSAVYVANYKEKKLSGPFKGSSFPNSLAGDPSATVYNTIVDKEHFFNNRTGHKGSTRKGLNIVCALGRKKWEGRYNPGFDPSGNFLTMYNVNVHSGSSNSGHPNSRGSHGCLTIYPMHADAFFRSIGYNNRSDATGDAEGGLYLFRETGEVTESIINALKDEFKE